MDDKAIIAPFALVISVLAFGLSVATFMRGTRTEAIVRESQKATESRRREIDDKMFELGMRSMQILLHIQDCQQLWFDIHYQQSTIPIPHNLKLPKTKEKLRLLAAHGKCLEKCIDEALCLGLWGNFVDVDELGGRKNVRDGTVGVDVSVTEGIDFFNLFLINLGDAIHAAEGCGEATDEDAVFGEQGILPRWNITIFFGLLTLMEM
jgi:hypothetical protein